ncbi:hypothetical protein TWF730_000879 [Orbilia blumenaviensis]|uniref:FAD-binding PCMH-type domain-containing protein n=1 Tax=Orbilia blumenaviensis TaxID=1796055 RepID=A0AAV9VU41_9PEZI
MRSSLSIAFFLSTCALLLPEASATQTKPRICCRKLSAKFQGQGKVAYPDTANYLAQNKYWSESSFLTPTCIFSPSSANDVAEAVRLFSRNSCVFAIRGGSHMPNSGFSSTDNGVLISLTGLNKLNYDASRNVIAIGAGNKWTNVYNFLDPKNVTVLGGRNSDVGVSGFLLGGGISYLSNSYGWACDNVVEYEVVLADGRIVYASNNSNTDLLRSLRGGSSNFGVVTSFTAKVYNVGPNASGRVYFPESSIPQLFGPLYNYIVNQQAANPKYHIIPNFVKIGTAAPRASFTQFYAEAIDLASPPPVMNQWINGTIPLQSQAVVNRQDAGGLAKLFGADAPPANRSQWHVTSIIADAQLFQDIYNIWLETSQPYETIPGWFNSIAMQPIGTKYVEVSQTSGGNALGITAPLVVVSANVYWSNASDDATVRQFLGILFKKIKDAAKAAGKESKYEYLNYGAANQKPIASYGRESLRKLAKAKRKYDPYNVFGTLVEGGFKIPGFQAIHG